MSFRQRLEHEALGIYEELLRQSPLVLILLSCLALALAATIAFGIHP